MLGFCGLVADWMGAQLGVNVLGGEDVEVHLALDDMLVSARRTVVPRVWSTAVKLAREGGVRGVSSDGEEISLLVKTRTRAQPFEVFLWPEEGDFGCDCGMDMPCVHICAALIAVNQGLKFGNPLPETKPRFKVSLRYDFIQVGARLTLDRMIVRPNGKVEPLKGTLAESNLFANRGDMHAEHLLATHRGGPLEEEKLRRLLVFLEGKGEATLNGEPVKLSAKPVHFVVKVRDEGTDAFRVGLYRPPGLEALFMGAAVKNGVLHPTSYGELSLDERKALHPRRTDRVFGMNRAGWLVSEYLPRLRTMGLPVEVETDRLPSAGDLVPNVIVEIGEVTDGLRVRPDLVYGDPPIARVRGGVLQKLGGTVPARDLAAERRVVQDFQNRVGLAVGFERVLRPTKAALFLREELPKLDVDVVGSVDISRFEIAPTAVQALIEVEAFENNPEQRDSGGFGLSVAFQTEAGDAEPMEVIRAWRSGRTLVPLMQGGYAPLPSQWLKEHGALLQELLEARDARGRVHRNATAALVELLEDTKSFVPPDLAKLREFLAVGEGLPEFIMPDNFQAELRPYQEIGYRWLRFLRQMDLNGVLADDMGLGKTVQTLAALASAEGPSLVVAPTSVIPNWQRESARFAPDLKVNVYHGPGRTLDTDSDIILTSYALLRLDLSKLKEKDWDYIVLDEAQAIKNPDSQTSRAAFSIDARHRLALTGTPVENRLEELWSLFRFLMPGLFGSKATFRDRFVRPIEVGDPDAKKALRQRVRPYVLRRLKRQVADDLPPLTDIVIRCEMGAAQRRVYETVRQAARREVMEAMKDAGGRYNMQVLEALLRMRQACCDPSLLPGIEHREIGAAKLDKLEELLVDLVSEGHKALVFSQWTSLLNCVQPRLDALGINWVRLDGGTRDRQGMIDKFQSDDGPPVFLLSLKAGGTGLNLTAADYVIHLDPWWNPAVQQQATDRAHRIGQERPVVSCRLIAQDTVEERILELQDAKRALADAALGADGGLLRALSIDELRSLFESA